MKLFFKYLTYAFICTIGYASAASWSEGVPIEIRKTDYAGLHLIFLRMEKAVTVGSDSQCDSNNGLIILDENESSKAALSMAMAAQMSGKKIRCYVTSNCSRIDGSTTTYPVCDYYPTLVN